MPASSSSEPVLISEAAVCRASSVLSNTGAVLSQSHRSDDDLAGPQEGHALPDERRRPDQPASAAEHDEFGLG